MLCQLIVTDLSPHGRKHIGTLVGHPNSPEPGNVGCERLPAVGWNIGQYGAVEDDQRGTARNLGDDLTQVSSRSALWTRGGSWRATSMAARKRASRSPSPGQTSASSQRVALSFRVSTGSRSIPARQATSGSRLGVGVLEPRGSQCNRTGSSPARRSPCRSHSGSDRPADIVLRSHPPPGAPAAGGARLTRGAVSRMPSVSPS